MWESKHSTKIWVGTSGQCLINLFVLCLFYHCLHFCDTLQHTCSNRHGSQFTCSLYNVVVSIYGLCCHAPLLWLFSCCFIIITLCWLVSLLAQHLYLILIYLGGCLVCVAVGIHCGILVRAGILVMLSFYWYCFFSGEIWSSSAGLLDRLYCFCYFGGSELSTI
jgi:hypothetical protein